MPAPTPDSARRRPAAGWLAFTALVLAVPLVWAVAEPLADPLRGPGVLAADAIWAGVLAALTGGLALGLGARGGRQGVHRGAIAGGGMAAVVIGAALAYGAAAGTVPAISGCAELPLPAAGVVDGRATVDGETVAIVEAAEADGEALVTLIAGLESGYFEDHGVEFVGAVPARRCSVLVDGTAALAALPQLRELGEDGRRLVELPVWRGELSWWKSADRQVALARALIGGHPADAWAERGLRGLIQGEMRPQHWMAR
jgi:hypothetical protein